MNRIWRAMRSMRRRTVAAISALVGLVVATLIGLVVSDIYEHATAPSPLEVIVEPERNSYVFPLPPSALPPPPWEDDIPVRAFETGCVTKEFPRWARALGAYDAGVSEVLVLLEGRSERPVVLDGVDVVVHSRRPQLAGAQFRCVDFFKQPVRHIEINLEADPPTIRGFEGYKLPKGEVERLSFQAFAGRCACTWSLRFRFAEGGERQTFVVDDSGEPFRTSGSRKAKPVKWSGNRWEVDVR